MGVSVCKYEICGDLHAVYPFLVAYGRSVTLPPLRPEEDLRWSSATKIAPAGLDASKLTSVK